MELLVKENAQDPLAARSTSRPICASGMGYRRSLVDTCKSSSVLVVSTLVAFMYLLFFALFLLSTDYVMMNCHCYTLWHVMTHDHVEKWAYPRSAGARLSTKRDWVRGYCLLLLDCKPCCLLIFLFVLLLPQAHSFCKFTTCMCSLTYFCTSYNSLLLFICMLKLATLWGSISLQTQ